MESTKSTEATEATEHKQCAICFETLSRFKREAKPNACDHSFCLSCLEMWALTKDTCPYCRGKFTDINVGGKRKRTTNVEEFRQQVIRQKRKYNRKELRKLQNHFNNGYVLRQIESITPGNITCLRWKFYPERLAQDGDVRTMEEAEEKIKLHAISKPGVFDVPIIID